MGTGTTSPGQQRLTTKCRSKQPPRPKASVVVAGVALAVAVIAGVALAVAGIGISIHVPLGGGSGRTQTARIAVAAGESAPSSSPLFPGETGDVSIRIVNPNARAVDGDRSRAAAREPVRTWLQQSSNDHASGGLRRAHVGRRLGGRGSDGSRR